MSVKSMIDNTLLCKKNVKIKVYGVVSMCNFSFAHAFDESLL